MKARLTGEIIKQPKHISYSKLIKRDKCCVDCKSKTLTCNRKCEMLHKRNMCKHDNRKRGYKY